MHLTLWCLLSTVGWKTVAIKILKFPLFFSCNCGEIQHKTKKIWKIHTTLFKNFPTLNFHSQEKRKWISKTFFCHSLPYSYSSYIPSVYLYSIKNTSISFLNCSFFQFSPSLLCLFQRLESHIRHIYLYHSSISHTQKILNSNYICIHNTIFFRLYS